MPEPGALAEMPRYKCHKEVRALKIAEVAIDAEGEPQETDGSAVITPDNARYAPFRVNREYMAKHRPVAGGYYVVYEDDYQSFSPAEAFEKGYTLIE